jgi:hypothetical protein
MATNFETSWIMNVGINHAPAYQVSGRPFASGGIDCSAAAEKVLFPTLTRWIVVQNNVDKALKVGYSKNGVDTDMYYTVQSGSSARLEVKVGEIWLKGSSNCDVAAGLTSIDRVRASGSYGPSWSGSSGVG